MMMTKPLFKNLKRVQTYMPKNPYEFKVHIDFFMNTILHVTLQP